jgi:hypothetical protein
MGGGNPSLRSTQVPRPLAAAAPASASTPAFREVLKWAGGIRHCASREGRGLWPLLAPASVPFAKLQPAPGGAAFVWRAGGIHHCVPRRCRGPWPRRPPPPPFRSASLHSWWRGGFHHCASREGRGRWPLRAPGSIFNSFPGSGLGAPGIRPLATRSRRLSWTCAPDDIRPSTCPYWSPSPNAGVPIESVSRSPQFSPQGL